MKVSRGFLAAAGIGFATGMRSMIGLAAVALAAKRGVLPLSRTPFRFLGSRRVSTALAIAAAGEMIADKLPFVPARIRPAPLLVRAASGALVGAAIGSASENSSCDAVLIGACSALLGAFAGYFTRAALGRSLRVNDLALAFPEDALAAGLAALAVTCR